MAHGGRGNGCVLYISPIHHQGKLLLPRNIPTTSASKEHTYIVPQRPYPSLTIAPALVMMNPWNFLERLKITVKFHSSFYSSGDVSLFMAI